MSVNKSSSTSSVKTPVGKSGGFFKIASLWLLAISSISAIYNLAIIGMVFFLRTNDNFRPFLWLYLLGLLLFLASFLVPRRIGWILLFLFLLLNQVAVLQATLHD